MVGVILVQWPTDSTTAKKSGLDSKLIGFVAVMISSFSSGFSGVYFEKLIKHSNQSLWTRNTQLAIISCVFAFSTILLNDYSVVSEKGFFHVRSNVLEFLNNGELTQQIILFRDTRQLPGVSSFCKPLAVFAYLL